MSNSADIERALEERRRAMRRCVQCGFLWSGGPDACTTCRAVSRARTARHEAALARELLDIVHQRRLAFEVRAANLGAYLEQQVVDAEVASTEAALRGHRG